jgi:hypothetical protein
VAQEMVGIPGCGKLLLAAEATKTLSAFRIVSPFSALPNNLFLKFEKYPFLFLIKFPE